VFSREDIVEHRRVEGSLVGLEIRHVGAEEPDALGVTQRAGRLEELGGSIEHGLRGGA
jgi:hypothetical protein